MAIIAAPEHRVTAVAAAGRARRTRTYSAALDIRGNAGCRPTVAVTAPLTGPEQARGR